MQEELYAALPIDADYLKKVYLFGLDLTDEDRNPYPDEMFENAIYSATSQLEMELDLSLFPIEFTDTPRFGREAAGPPEEHDYESHRYQKFVYLNLDYYPVLEVRSVTAQFPFGTEVVRFPTEWITVDKVSGRVQIVPRTAAPGIFLVGTGQVMLPLLRGAGYLPNFFYVDYAAGFAPGKLPWAIRHVIGMMASIEILNVAGDLINGPGIARTSLTLNGMREEIDTTASATNAGYGARILNYERQIREKLPVIRRYWKGIGMVVA